MKMLIHKLIVNQIGISIGILTIIFQPALTAFAAQYSQSARVNVIIGNPSNCPQGGTGNIVIDTQTPCGWPTTGQITTLPFQPGTLHGDYSLAAFDIASVDGLPGQRIYATHDGIAHVFTGTKPPNNLADRVVTVASSRYITKYQHLLKWCVRDGANVTRGTLIGLMDSTGVSTGNHLHYEIRKPSGAQVSLEEINNLVPPYSLGQIVTTAYSGGNESNCYAP